MAKEIKLTRGLVATVDDEDFDDLNQWKWYAHNTGNHRYYAARTQTINGKPTIIYMHRIVSNAPNGIHIDHKNRDRLDNQKSNLRKATRSQNLMNRRSPGGVSIYKGVFKLHTSYNLKKNWVAMIKVNNVRRYLGYYETQEEAARAYDAAAIEMAGEFAWLNFPNG